ncbi:MAG: cation-translocating P-type ATPase [Elusimicrobia bacterium]|nr:cation-translocating P-type ATPase [Elusimicrobiota bacterium]
MLKDRETAAWHRLPPEEALSALGSSAAGLSAAEAAARLAENGPNALASAPRRSAAAIFLAQFADVLVVVLLAAAVVSGVIGDLEDTVVIAVILVLNAAIGFFQEYRAENALAALKAMTAPTALARRDGELVTVAAADLVTGDVVALEAGAVVPADLRLLEAARLNVNESALTGESVPVEKSVAAVDKDIQALGDRRNMAYAGTIVTGGRGTGVVAAVAMATEFGRVAGLLRDTEEVGTPLQKRLASFGRRLAGVVLGICALVFAAGVLRGEPVLQMLLTAVSLAVAAVPEALPAVVTISLALGALKMAKQNALVRRLPAVETLGSVTVICSDKTGTLTLNKMRVEEMHGEGEGLVAAMALCSDAREDSEGRITGDPTEAALLSAALSAGADLRALARLYPRLEELPFDPERKLMTTFHRHPEGGFVSFTKGAAEAVLERCDAAQPEAAKAAEKQAASGLRVLALASRRWAERPATLTHDRAEAGLTLLGVAGLLDPPRPAARASVLTCTEAGIKTIMITGDHPLTASAIARRLGILNGDDGVMDGVELASLGDEEFARRVEGVRVYARVAPEQKLRIVKALQRHGEVVAMTGDGVNDAPALRRAEIGVAMGVAGTDAAKEASAMVLLDDDFATIVAAVREGRRLYDNIRRFVKYQLTTNSAEVWIIASAPVLGLPIPLLPIHILWINLLTDGLPGLALVAEPAEAGLMRRGPRPPGESIFAHGLGLHAVWVGVLMSFLALGAQFLLVSRGDAHWRTMIFTVLVFTQMGHVLAIRSERESLFSQGLLSNKPLFAAVAGMILLQLAAVYLPPFQRALKTQALSPGELAAAAGLSTVVFFAVELEKWLRRRGARG